VNDKGVAMPRIFDDDYKSKRDVKDCGWKKQERRVAKKVGGKVQPGSGSKDFAKGDIKEESFLVECKFTEKQSIRVELKWLKKISREAMAEGKIPALSVEIQHDDHLTAQDWTMIPTEALKELLGKP